LSSRHRTRSAPNIGGAALHWRTDRSGACHRHAFCRTPGAAGASAPRRA
jgi:hypothetical protein